MRIVMDYALAHAAGTDAANRQMKAAGRTRWNEDDYNLAGRTLDRLYPDPNAPTEHERALWAALERKRIPEAT